MKSVVFSALFLSTLSVAQAYAACTSPAGVEGEIIYNRQWKVMQFCDNEHWIGMGGSSNLAAGNIGEIQFKGAGDVNAADPALTWDNTNKRLGVGTASPLNPLHVKGSGAIVNIERNSGAFAGMDFSHNGVSEARIAVPATGTGAISFEAGGVGNSNERMRIMPSGNVGIGTSAPRSPLSFGSQHSLPSTTPNKISLWQSGDNNYFGFGISEGNLDYFTQANHQFYTGFNGVAGSVKMTILSNGNVGIGISNPTSKLDVAGSMNLIGNLTGGSGSGAHNFHIDAFNSGVGTRGLYLNYYTGTGVYLAGGTAVTSDIRKKKDIEPVTNALDKLAQIRGVSYRWKDPERPQELQLGVIAQEVQAVFPDLVKEDGYGSLTVVYDGLTAPIIEAIKELKAENDSLKAAYQTDIDALRAEIEALKARKD